MNSVIIHFGCPVWSQTFWWWWAGQSRAHGCKGFILFKVCQNIYHDVKKTKKKNPLEFVQSEANKKIILLKNRGSPASVCDIWIHFRFYSVWTLANRYLELYVVCLPFAPHLWNLPPAQSSCFFFHSKESWVFYIRCLIRVISEEGFRSEGHSMAGNGRHTHSIWVVSMKDGENVILY